jgi:hypothetical protein
VNAGHIHLAQLGTCANIQLVAKEGHVSVMARSSLVEDIFEVLEKDPDGPKYDKGS